MRRYRSRWYSGGGLRARALGIVLFMGLLTVPSRASAGDTLSGDAMAAVLTIALASTAVAGVNTTFTVYDTTTAASDEMPSTGWAAAETAVEGALGVGLNVVVVLVENIEQDEVAARIFVDFAAMWSTALAVHGVWSLATQSMEPWAVLGTSGLIGIDVPLATAAIANGVQARLSAPTTAVLELVSTPPGIAVSCYEAATSPEYRGGWIALAASSGALLLHGVASLIWGEAAEKQSRHRRRSQLQPLDAITLTPLLAPSEPAPTAGMALAGRF